LALSKENIKKIEKFKRQKRAYICFLILATAFLLILPVEFIANSKPLFISKDGNWYFPLLVNYTELEFGGSMPSEPDYLSESFLELIYGVQKNNHSQETKRDSGDYSVDMSDFEDEDEAKVDDEVETAVTEVLPEDPKIYIVEMSDFDENDEVGLALTHEQPQSADTKTHNAKTQDTWVLWPLIKYDYKYIPTTSLSGAVVLAAPYETLDVVSGKPIVSSWIDGHYLGTDDRGRDVLARLLYGFRISLVFGLCLAICGTFLGCLIGGVQGFFGGWVDLFGQRVTELWGSIPRLYILIILSAFLTPSVILLFFILNLTSWMGMAAYIRAEFLKIRNLEFVKAAKSMGVSSFKIMRKHILPNAITPIVTFFPFEVTAGILALVSLDFLNLGVPSPSPSLGELLSQGKANLHALWISLPTFFVLTITLTLLTFIGEGVRSAFDPKEAT